MPKQQFDLFEMPPFEQRKGFSKEEVTTRDWKPKFDGHQFYLAAQELVHFSAYLKLNEWQQQYLWPHLDVLLNRIKNETREDVIWFELGYIISAMEIEQIRSRSAALEICKKYGIEI